jgi:hypothetical protein
MHDPELLRPYVAAGDQGVISVVDAARFEVIETVATEPGAHTLGIDPDHHAVYAFYRSAAARRSTWISDRANAAPGAPCFS